MTRPAKPEGEGREARLRPVGDEAGASLAEPEAGHAGAIQRALELEREAARGRRRRRRGLWGLVALLALLAVLTLVRGGRQEHALYGSVAVERGDLTVTVTATGTLQPLKTVQVGAEISGRIDTVEVDYNDRVERGQLLARLDTEQLEAAVVEAEASLQAARSSVREARATADKTRRELARAEGMYRSQVISEQELDRIREAASLADAALASARSRVTVAEATLAIQRTHLEKAEIRSPIDGLVLVRNVDPGQTVAAAFQTPLLFEIAEDLSVMRLHVDVDEADVGSVREGQVASFSVDAYPDRRFAARIAEVRYAPRTVEGVVTYEAVLDVDNAGLLLRPGMTATAAIETASVRDALLVPNAALRFLPAAPEDRPLWRRWLGWSRPREEAVPGAERLADRVWALRDGEPLAIPVTPGLSDGRRTQIRDGELEPGTRLLVERETPAP